MRSCKHQDIGCRIGVSVNPLGICGLMIQIVCRLRIVLVHSLQGSKNLMVYDKEVRVRVTGQNISNKLRPRKTESQTAFACNARTHLQFLTYKPRDCLDATKRTFK